MPQISWKEALRGEAYNTWLSRLEREKLLSTIDSLDEDTAKKIYYEVKAKIRDRLGYWEQSL